MNQPNGTGVYTMYKTDSSFAGSGARKLEITVVARRIAPDKPSGMNICYESLTGYKGVPKGFWNIPDGDGWQEHTWKVDDANLVGAWGYSLRTDSIGMKNEFLIKEVRIKKVGN